MRSLFGAKRSLKRGEASSGGRLIYAVGDIHGRFDLLHVLLHKIVQDWRSTPTTQRPILAFLGDYVDRGPDSVYTVECLIQLRDRPEFEVHTLLGNHEQCLLEFLEDPATGPRWMEFGGAATLISYGVSPPSPLDDRERMANARDAFANAIPPSHLEFFKSLEPTLVCGDYVMVHAGVRPGVPLEQQALRDLLWIRSEFLNSKRPSDRIVVHGHSADEEPHLLPHRIGVDTGAYATGVLTAAKIQDGVHRLIQADLLSSA